jgi:hypothetical protein
MWAKMTNLDMKLLHTLSYDRAKCCFQDGAIWSARSHKHVMTGTTRANFFKISEDGFTDFRLDRKLLDFAAL